MLTEMCPRGQVLGLEDRMPWPWPWPSSPWPWPRQTSPWPGALGLGGLALEIKYYHFFFWFMLLSSLFGELTYAGSNNCGRPTVQCLIHTERT